MDHRKELAKGRLEDYLRQKGLNTKKPFHCLNPDHADKNPSMSFDRRRNKVHCFACGADYDIFDLVGLEHRLRDVAEIFAKTYQVLGLPSAELPSRDGRKSVPKGGPVETPSASGQLPVQAVKSPPSSAPLSSPAVKLSPIYQKYLKKCRERLGETDYPARRGLSAKICEHFGLGFDPAFAAGGEQRWAALIIPTGPDSFTARNTDPAADKSSRIRKKGASPVFNADVMWEEAPVSDGRKESRPPETAPGGVKKPVFVVEGEIDALAVAEGGGAAVALGSTANVGAFLKLVQARPPRRPLLIALDNDEEGARAADKLEEGLVGLRTPFFRVNPYGAAKDAGEALTADPGAFSEALRAAENFQDQIARAERETYLAASAAHHLDEFRGKINASADTPVQPTGFQVLDKTLDGGLYEGFYVVGGISSLGKTTLVTQMADQVAQAGGDVLIFSLEMARSELMAKSLSRLTLLKALECGLTGASAKTARGITSGARYARYNGTELRLIGAAIDSYSEYSHKIFISEGVGDIGAAEVRREVEKHLRFTGLKPVVIIDYLQILAPPSERSTDKQNVDKNVLELKRLSRDYKIPVIGLSSFNRANYREAVTMEAFKESGAIEYSSDVLLGLQLKGAGEKDFDALAEKDKNPRRVELVVLKNRQGPAGGRVEFEYYPMFNYFKEC